MSDLLVVDLDHTLVKVDLLVEQLLIVARRKPQALLRAIRALVPGGGGRAAFKAVIAGAAEVDAVYLPYRASILELIDAERRNGASAVLASASHRSVVEKVARHLGRFDRVFGTTDRNLKGGRKLEEIRRAFPATPFVYVGDSAADRPLWSACSRAVVVNPSVPLRRWLASLPVPVQVLRDDGGLAGAVLRQLRAHRWIRNLLAFLPLIGAPWVGGELVRAAVAFFALSFLSSAGYVLNDLADLPGDRRHPLKRNRPLAAGDLRPGAAILLFVVLLLGAAVPAAALPGGFAAALGAFFVVSIAYSIWLKHLLLVDVFARAALHGLRITAGVAAMGLALSAPLLAFALFLFVGLGLAGRYVEIERAELPGDAGLGAYRREDHEALYTVGAVCSFLAAPALMLYLADDALRQVPARGAPLLLTVPVLMYWIGRYLILAHREEPVDGPFAFALRDKATWCVAALALVLILLGRV